MALRHVEDYVVRASRKPQHGIVLRCRHHEAVDAGYLLIKAFDTDRRVVGGSIAPEFRPKPCHQVDPTHRRPRLPEGQDRNNEVTRVPPERNIELKIGVSCGSKGKYPALGSTHAVVLLRRIVHGCEAGP